MSFFEKITARTMKLFEAFAAGVKGHAEPSEEHNNSQSQSNPNPVQPTRQQSESANSRKAQTEPNPITQKPTELSSPKSPEVIYMEPSVNQPQPAQPIFVEPEVVAPEQKVKINVQVDVPDDVQVEVDIKVKPKRQAKPRAKKRWERQVGDYSTFCDGVKATPTQYYQQYVADSTELVLALEDRSQLDIDWPVDRSLKYYEAYEEMLEQRRESEEKYLPYACYDESAKDLELFGPEKLAYEFSPTLQQMHNYYSLCRLCDEYEIDYNHDVRPENSREFQLAIIALAKLLRQNNKGRIVVQQLGKIPRASNSALHQSC